jgi:hypothetical protein
MREDMTQVIKRFEEVVSYAILNSYEAAILSVYGHLPKNQLYADMIKSNDHITLLTEQVELARKGLQIIAEEQDYTALRPDHYNNGWNNGWNAGRSKARAVALDTSLAMDTAVEQQTTRSELTSAPCPAPWCAFEESEVVVVGYRGMEFVLCGSCGCTGPEGSSASDAIVKWNTRPTQLDEPEEMS